MINRIKCLLKATTVGHPWLAGVLALVPCLFFWFLNITGEEIRNDASQTLRMAVNLQHHGVMSSDKQAPFLPSNVREPLPVLLTSIFIAIDDFVSGQADSDDDYFAGRRASVLKLQNLLWLSLLVMTVYFFVLATTRSYKLALATVAAVNLPLLEHNTARYMIDSLYTEAPATALLVLASALVVVGFCWRSWAAVAGAGIAFGALTLVKAIFLYVFAGFILALGLGIGLRLLSDRALVGLSKIVVLASCFAIVVFPWMYRNYVELGSFATTARGPEALYIRAVENGMTPIEIQGALSYWAPWPINGILRRAFGFERDDERLKRLFRGDHYSFADADRQAEAAGRPQDAISYYRKALAETVRLRQLYAARGHPDPDKAAVDATMKEAVQMISERPIRHLLMSALFIWRGAFFTFPVLGLIFVVSIIRKNVPMSLFVLPALGMILLYGLVSHFIPRYSIPATSVAIVAAAIYCFQWFQKRTSKSENYSLDSSLAY